MSIKNLEYFLSEFVDNGTIIKRVSTYRNFVFFAKYNGAGIYVKFCSEDSNSKFFAKEKTILLSLPEINPFLSIPKIVEGLPSAFNDLPMHATYELPGCIVREVPINKRVDALKSWARTKKILHQTDLTSELANEMKRSFEQTEDMYIYFANKWREGLYRSMNFAPETISKSLKYLDKLIQIASNGASNCLIQGDSSLENAIYNVDGSVSLIDYEKATIGDPLWDIFGFVQDHSLIMEFKNEILTEAGYPVNNFQIERKIAAITALSAIEWFANFTGIYNAVCKGYIKGITFEQLVRIAINQFNEGLKNLSLP